MMHMIRRYLCTWGWHTRKIPCNIYWGIPPDRKSVQIGAVCTTCYEIWRNE